jgi:hypothetical protein
MEQDQLIRTYVRLSALMKNLESKGSIKETYVSEYHSIVTQLEAGGWEIEEFKIPETVLHQRVTSWNPLSGHKTLSKNRFVAGAFFMSKLDAILGYFDLLTEPEEKKHIGFSAPTRKRR